MDEIGFCPRVKDEANLLFQVSSYRYEWNAPGLTEAPFLGFSRILEEGVRAP